MIDLSDRMQILEDRYNSFLDHFSEIRKFESDLQDKFVRLGLEFVELKKSMEQIL